MIPLVVAGGAADRVAFLDQAAVLESAVFGIPDDEWGEAVKAVVVLKPGATASEEEIKKRLRGLGYIS